MAEEEGQTRAQAQRLQQKREVKPTKRLLSRETVDLVVQRKWKELLAWIVFEPQELKWLDKNGQTILHQACLFRAPAEILQMILWQAPELASTPNPDGEVPLHWSIRLSASNECLQALIDADAGEGGCTARRDKDGNTPLSLLWDRHQQTICDTFWVSSNRTEAVLQLHCWKRILLFFPCQSSGDADDDDADGKHDADSCPDENNTCGGRQRGETHVQRQETVLHVASERCLPPGFFAFLLAVYASKDDDYHSSLKRQDGYGRIPLHRACRNAVTNRSTDAVTKIRALIQACPETAHIACATTRRLPLHFALEAGISWKEGIADLIRCNPFLLQGGEGRDPVTGLDPFLLAAAAAPASDATAGTNVHAAAAVGATAAQHHRDDDKNRLVHSDFEYPTTARINAKTTAAVAAPLSTIYTLLRMDPSRCCACRTTIHPNA